MRKSIKFCVKEEGQDMLPPKKVKPSMWGDETEVPRLIALRTRARHHMRACGYDEPFALKIRLTLHVYMSEDPELVRKGVKFGDLDNFITGVCDGLMAADDNVLCAESLHDDFKTADAVVHPREPIAYEDDSQIREICAKKIVRDGDDWYRVELEELEDE